MFETPEFAANPYPTYRKLREQGSLHWVDSFGGAWLLPCYADVAQTLRDPRLSTKANDIFLTHFSRELQSEFAQLTGIMSLWMHFLEPREHARVRKLMNKGFVPRLLDSMRPRFQKIADDLLDRVQESGQMDFMRDFAQHFPMLAIAEIMGIDPEDRERFIAWSKDIIDFVGSPEITPEIARRAQNTVIALTDYFRALLPERRQNGGNDLVSFLIRAEEEGDVLTVESLLAQCSQLITAGHESTVNLLGNGILALLQHREQLKMLQNDPSLIPNALRELLRYDSPLQLTTRVATEDLTLCGQHFKPGETTILLIGSANRDPAKFPNPDVLDITRKADAHLAFGYGPHVCIGASLVYVEAEIAFNTLLRRMPDLQLVNDRPDWGPGGFIRGLNTLPLTF